MSEDTDERMERASRIRQMREGQREAGIDDEGDTEEASEADSEVGETEKSAAEESTTESGPRRDAEMNPEMESEDDGDGSGQAEEATAAAERAAQAAAQVTGGATGDGASAEATGADTASTGTAAGPSASPESNQPAGVDASAPMMQGPTGVELPDEESLRAAIADEVLESDSEPAAGPATGRGAAAQESATAEETVRVLEFTLGDEHYCLDIAHVEEIVKRESITRVPNTPEYVEGVVDLRGQITTILDPKLLLDIDQEGSESLLVVFAPDEFEDQGAIGWVVDEVRQVAPIVKSEVSAAPVDAEYIEGVIDRDDEAEFVIWTNPEMAIRLATGEHDTED